MKRGHRHSAEARRRIAEAKRGHRHSAETRRRIAESVRAAMAEPEVRQKISEGTKRGMGTLPELTRLRGAWRAARPSVRQSFILEVLAPVLMPMDH